MSVLYTHTGHTSPHWRLHTPDPHHRLSGRGEPGHRDASGRACEPGRELLEVSPHWWSPGGLPSTIASTGSRKNYSYRKSVLMMMMIHIYSDEFCFVWWSGGYIETGGWRKHFRPSPQKSCSFSKCWSDCWLKKSSTSWAGLGLRLVFHYSPLL